MRRSSSCASAAESRSADSACERSISARDSPLACSLQLLGFDLRTARGVFGVGERLRLQRLRRFAGLLQDAGRLLGHAVERELDRLLRGAADLQLRDRLVDVFDIRVDVATAVPGDRRAERDVAKLRGDEFGRDAPA